MNFETYEKEGRAAYQALAETVAAILTVAVEAQPDLRLQHVQHRAKEPAKLKPKLEERGAFDSDTIETAVKDLAGCRLVFYTNSDVNQFLSSGIVRDNFDVDWDRTKIHYPGSDTSDASELFISNNYVVKLKDDRVALPEYGRFRDMWCEVQVQTALNHAWSEMAHDTIYKTPELKGFGGGRMKSIEKRMETIMRDYLLPAGYEFQKVAYDFERLSSGKDLFDLGALEALAECEDNNALHDLLQRFETYVLPGYDDPQSVSPEIRSSMIAAVTQAREAPTQAIETPFGAVDGHTIEQIVDIAAGVLDQLRYSDVEATFDAICELYLGAKSEEEKNRWLQSAEHLAKHELEIWKQVGPLVQLRLVTRIRGLSQEVLNQLRPVVIEVLGQVLTPVVTGTSSSYKTVTFHTGAVVPSEELGRARAGAIDVLKTLFQEAKNHAERRAVMQALSAAMETPHLGDYSNSLRKVILDDTRKIVEFYTEIANDQSYELLQTLEENLLWKYRHNRDMPDKTASDPDIAPAREALTKSILGFRDRVNADRDFVVYKTLVGFQSVFPPAWEDEEFDLRGEKDYREERIKELVEEVTEENADTWLATLQRCAQTESSDGATFPSFGHFLEELGRSKPQILFGYLDRLGDRLANFLPSMLIGLEGGAFDDDVRAKVLEWVKEGRYLRQIVRYLHLTAKFDAGLLEKSLRAAMKAGDDGAVLNAVTAAKARHDDAPTGLIDAVLLPAIDYLASKGDTLWVNAMWPRPKKSSLFRDLRSDQADALLSSLVPYPRIEYQAEELLTRTAAIWPVKVADFFGKRLGAEKPSDAGDRYDVIPFSLHSLHEPLAKIPDELVGKARAWFDADRELFEFRGGRLLAIVFPAFPSEFQRSLRPFLERGDRTDIEFVVKTLRSYQGQAFLHEFCKEIVAALGPDDPLLTEVGIVLDSTGVVTGEFGFVAAYEQKKAALQSWLDDTRENVRSFAERHMESLDRYIAVEQRRAEESLELRKREYDEVDDTDD